MVSNVIFTDIDVRYVDGSEDQFTVDPIELAFAKLKAFLRAERPRSFDQGGRAARRDRAGAVFTLECLNFVRHFAYRVSKAL
jgi:hypothetical protein